MRVGAPARVDVSLNPMALYRKMQDKYDEMVKMYKKAAEVYQMVDPMKERIDELAAKVDGLRKDVDKINGAMVDVSPPPPPKQDQAFKPVSRRMQKVVRRM